MNQQRAPTSAARQRLITRFDMSPEVNQRKLDAADRLAQVSDAQADYENRPGLSAWGTRCQDAAPQFIPASSTTAGSPAPAPTRRTTIPGKASLDMALLLQE
jgi:hypothetical protein